MRTVIWFKRDLRLHDHAPLHAALTRGDVLPVYLLEPSWLGADDASARHRGFLLESLAALDRALRQRGSRLWLGIGEVAPTLQRLHQAWPFQHLASHEETGNDLSFRRDREVAAWCKATGVQWHEHRQFGVARGLRDRDRWTRVWDAVMDSPCLPAPGAVAWPADAPPGSRWPEITQWLHDTWPDASDIPDRQRGGRVAAEAVFSDFLQHRARRYRGSLSSPLTAALGGSRLSPYLAWGCLSMRETVAGIRSRRDSLDDIAPEARGYWLRSLAAVESRLHWHCHFIQKLESEPAMERRNMNRAFDGLRDESLASVEAQRRLAAWTAGETGYPLIDACLAMLRETGWVNFRMRAMLVSFATQHLWLHWRQPGLHLAREFLDYEPGIHYPQLQMQAGVTGINTIRVYNPVKQQRDQDPDGAFVRRWLPALANVPTSFLAEPWRMPPSLQQRSGCVLGTHYPVPVVDHEQAAREAKALIHAWKRQPETRAASQQVFVKHGSRLNPKGREGGGRKTVPAPDRQLGLDWG